MKYLKTFEEINWNQFKKRKPFYIGNTVYPFGKISNETLGLTLLGFQRQIEDCLLELMDISTFSYVIRELQWYKKSRALVYEFKLNTPISKELYGDYIYEITGRISDIGKSQNAPSLKCYYSCWWWI